MLKEAKAVARAIMVDPSEKVVISAREGSIRWVECVLGALLSGGVPTHINPSCSLAQFEQCIETCQTLWLFIDDKLVCSATWNSWSCVLLMCEAHRKT